MRLAGAFLLTGAFFLVGAGVAGEKRAECRTLEAVLRLLRTLLQRLTWKKEPLGRFFAEYSDPVLDRAGFCACVTESASFSEGWKSGVAALSLPKEAKETLSALGDDLGTLGAEPQKERIALCVSVCAEILSACSEREKKQRRSTVALWTLAGVLLSVLMM